MLFRSHSGPPPGTHLIDATLPDGTYLTDAFRTAGNQFTLLRHGTGPDLPTIPTIDISFAPGYDTTPGDAYLLRPDGYVAARLRNADTPRLTAALTRAQGHPP